jgi:transcriptional regulator with XRE-family HTH domain
MLENFNERLAWLRKERGITLVDLAGMLNESIGAATGSKLYQTADKIFTYERKTKPVKPKFEVVRAYCELFLLSEDELRNGDIENLNLFDRWSERPLPVLKEPEALYGKQEQDEIVNRLISIETKLDELLKRKK